MTDSAQSVTKVVPISSDRLFAVLVDPTQHQKIDGSNTVRAAVTTEPITKVGDVFRTNMYQPSIGDYQIDNRVVDFVDRQKIAWAPGLADRDPLGHIWIWELSGDGESTTVTHTYDWSGVTDEAVLARIPFPSVTAEQMASSVDNLVAAAS